MPRSSKFRGAISWFASSMSGWRFPALAIFILFFFEVLLITILAIPPSDTGVGAFVRDFQTWCFNYDPATAEVDWFYVAIMLSNPIGLAVVISVIWWDQLKEAFRNMGGELALIAGIALIGVGLVGLSFFIVGEPAGFDGEYPFPAERIRTEIEPPEFELTDHTGEEVSLEDFQGEVVVVTAVYATCSGSCPVILTELRRVTDQLTDAQREDLTVMGITLDPDEDGPEELTNLAKRHGVEAPLYRLLHGDPDEVNKALDDFSIARIPDEERGEIDHANLFFVIDRDGKIAYRLALGDRTENWLLTALRTVLDEGQPTGDQVAKSSQ